MKQRTLLVIAIVLISVGTIGLAATTLVNSAFIDDRPGARGDARTGGTDAMFIEQMVPHHQDAIDMSELALTRAEHPEIRALAASIKESQSAENEQMRAWYQEWYGTTVPDRGGRGGSRGPMRGPMMGGRTDLDRLETAKDFDREFIEQMVPHHQMGIMMARMAGASTQRPEIRRLTDSIIETQTREIEQMQAWYREWYGR